MGKLKARVKALDGIPDNLKDLYVQRDGGYVIDAHPDGDYGFDNVGKLKAERATALGDLERARLALKKFQKDDGELMDLDELTAGAAKSKELEEQLAAIQKKGGGLSPAEIDQRIQNATAEAKKAHAKEADKLRKDLTETRQKHQVAMRKLAAEQALSESHPLADFQPFIRQQLLDAIDLEERESEIVARVRSEDGKGYRPSMATGNDGPMTPTEYARETLRTKFPKYFEGDGQSGAGFNGSNRNGSPRKITITETQCQDNPRLYTQRCAPASQGGPPAGQGRVHSG